MNERRLDIGCGYTRTDGYERADIDTNCPDLDFVCPIDAVPVPDGTFDRVRASHVIEHVPIDGARRALREWLRILRPGSIAWIDTPNIERNARLYSDGTWTRDFDTLTQAEQDRCTLNGVPNRTLWLNFKVFSTEMTWNVHYANYDSDLLIALCLEAGFERATVTQTDPSLIIQAVKSEAS